MRFRYGNNLAYRWFGIPDFGDGKSSSGLVVRVSRPDNARLTTLREAASYGRASEIGRLPHSLLATGSTLANGTGKYCSFAAFVVISQSQKAAGKKLGRIGKEMKGFGIALALILAAYLADAKFSNGKYADAATRMAVQMRHSFGI